MAGTPGDPAAGGPRRRAGRGAPSACHSQSDACVRPLMQGALQCGLDTSARGSKTPEAEQQAVLRQQMQLAKRLRRPLSVCPCSA